MSTRDWNHYLLPVAAVIASATPFASVYADDYLTIVQAQAQLFPNATKFDEKMLHFTDADRDSIKRASGMRQRWDEQKFYRAERDGILLGWILIDDVIGKHEFITYATAISTDGTVLGIEILSYRETHGGEVRDTSWRKNFVGKKLGDQFKLDEDVPNISGATLSCRNLLDGVKRLLTVHKLFLARS